MKYKSICLACLAFLTGCETEIDLFAPGDPVPVVYCLLDPEDSMQYVRLGSTYPVYPGDTNFRPAQDEILLKGEMEVYLSAEYSDRSQEIYYGKPIDTIPKDSGWFPSAVNQMYAIPCILRPSTKYSLYIRFPETNRIIHGETVSMGGPLVVVNPELVPGREATLIPGIDYFVHIETMAYGPIFQSTMTFRYAELRNGVRSDCALVFKQPFGYAYDTTQTYGELRISGDRFLIDVSRSIQPEPGVKRIPLGLDFFISCGGTDLALKIRAENDKQSFSILEVNNLDNAFGIFSCLTHHYVNNIPLSRFTIDTLALGPLTRDLGFLTKQQIDSL
jgi:hypothetical protein